MDALNQKVIMNYYKVFNSSMLDTNSCTCIVCKYRISNELSFITKFITWVGKHDIMRGSAEHNIIFANECNKFSNKWQRIWDFIYYITVKTIGILIFQL